MNWFHIYKDFVSSLSNPKSTPQETWLHGPVGVAKEAGELLDNVYRYWNYGKNVDKENILEECGDILYYLQLTLNQLDLNILDAMKNNMKKLQSRYPEGKFTEKAALERADKIEGDNLLTEATTSYGKIDNNLKPGTLVGVDPVNEWLHEEPSIQTKPKCHYCETEFNTGHELANHYSEGCIFSLPGSLGNPIGG